MQKESSEYNELVLDHYRNPRNFGKLVRPTHTASELNPLCGDEITVYLEVRGNKIENLKYEARGCALSIAAASVLAERMENGEWRIGEVRKIGKSDIEEWLGVKVGKAREGCVTLAVNTIKKVLSFPHPPSRV